MKPDILKKYLVLKRDELEKLRELIFMQALERSYPKVQRPYVPQEWAH